MFIIYDNVSNKILTSEPVDNLSILNFKLSQFDKIPGQDLEIMALVNPETLDEIQPQSLRSQIVAMQPGDRKAFPISKASTLRQYSYSTGKTLSITTETVTNECHVICLMDPADAIKQAEHLDPGEWVEVKRANAAPLFLMNNEKQCFNVGVVNKNVYRFTMLK